MTSKTLLTPSRNHPSDSNSPREDSASFQYEPQYQNLSNPQSSAKKKSHHPLNLGSTKFQVKSFIPSPFFQDQTGGAFDSTDVTHSCVMAEPIHGPSHIPIIEHLDLNMFKIKPCPLTSQHNHKHCPFYHNAKDRKRLGFFYSAELCDYAEKEGVTCPNGDMCQKAHNRVEQLYRPEKYKTKFCTFYPNNLEKCDYGIFCSFAHNENDISIELIHNYEYDDDFYMFHFKTVWCPFNLTQHDKALCVYAHNWQDYRRKPNAFSYDPVPCPNWKSTDFILNYEDGCPFKEKCTKCHGWKEHEYHPLNFKSKSCPAGKNCNKGRDCPHFHSAKERRVINTNVGNKVFRFVPRNRIVTNTFKVRNEDRMGYNVQQQQSYPTTSTPSMTSLGSFPSATLSYESEALVDQFPPLSEQYLPSRNNMLNVFADMHAHAKTPDFRGNEEFPDVKLIRQHSYDYEIRRPRNNSSTNASSTMPRTEILPIGLEKSNGNSSIPKVRRWSTHEEGGFVQESDRLFREIVMSSMNKKITSEAADSPAIKTSSDKEDAGNDAELDNKIMLDRILESEDN